MISMTSYDLVRHDFNNLVRYDFNDLTRPLQTVGRLESLGVGAKGKTNLISAITAADPT